MQRRERFINYRDLWREMEELSDEENAVDDQVCLHAFDASDGRAC